MRSRGQNDREGAFCSRADRQVIDVLMKVHTLALKTVYSSRGKRRIYESKWKLDSLTYKNGFRTNLCNM